jgi:hypothetical protein
MDGSRTSMYGETPTAMRRWMLAPLCCATSLAFAQVPDTTASPACQQAMAALQQQEASVLASRGGGSNVAPSPTDSAVAAARLQPWRERAARACLGARGNAYAPATSTARNPVSVPPVTLGPPVKMPPAPTMPAAPAAPLRSDTLTTVVGCDASGCWASDGTRLTRNGSVLTGPHGTCTQQGAVLRCP